ncbi:hypothetical protein LguiA_012365 [Lonicera macranthoides]
MGRVRSKRCRRRSSRREQVVVKSVAEIAKSSGGRRKGFYSSLISLFRKERRQRNKPAVKMSDPAEESSPRNSVSSRAREVSAVDPPSLGGMTSGDFLNAVVDSSKITITMEWWRLTTAFFLSVDGETPSSLILTAFAFLEESMILCSHLPSAEKIIKWAFGCQLMHYPQNSADSNVVLSKERIFNCHELMLNFGKNGVRGEALEAEQNKRRIYQDVSCCF